MSDTVTTTIEDGIAVVRLDDGKMNAIGYEVIEALHVALDRAADEAGAVCLIGNDRALSAGFDLAVMTAGPDAVRDLVGLGGRLIMRLYGHPQPTVVAVTGHALAAGALLTLACDTRVAADRPSKIGLNEVAIGMSLPAFGVELAHARLSKRAVTRAVLQAELFDPAGALAVGYVDSVVTPEACADAAVGEARRLAELRRGAYAITKRALRQATVDHVLATLDDDLAALTGPTGGDRRPSG